jgi:hypothetical protein
MRSRLEIYPTKLGSKPYGLFESRRRTLAFIRELSWDLLDIEPRLGNYRNKRGEHRVYEYDKNIHVIDVEGIKGYIAGEEDLLVSNWWALFLGLIRDTDVSDVVQTDNYAVSLRTSTDVNGAGAYISYGTGTTPESFTDNTLKSRSGSISTSITIGYMSDRTRVTLSGTLTSAASELGIEQPLFRTDGNAATFLLGRRTGSWSANQAVAWYIDFLSPWVSQVGSYMYGILMDANVAITRIDGVSFTARTRTDSQSGSAYLVASSSSVTWSPSLYNIPNAFSLSNYIADVLGTRYIRATFFHGLYSPANDIQVNTIGLYFPTYDTSGSTQTVCLMVQPLSSPVTLYAGRNNLIVLRIVAM